MGCDNRTSYVSAVETIANSVHRDPDHNLRRAVPDILEQATFVYRTDMGIYCIGSSSVSDPIQSAALLDATLLCLGKSRGRDQSIAVRLGSD